MAGSAYWTRPIGNDSVVRWRVGLNMGVMKKGVGGPCVVFADAEGWRWLFF